MFAFKAEHLYQGGKKAMAKMDSRLRELESEVDAENRRLVSQAIKEQKT
jgi:hypothetical protein